MTTYKGIKGLSIQTVDGDPSVLAAGDIWYDSAAKKVQGAKISAGAWASGTAVNTARRSLASAGQTSTDALIAGGIGGTQLNEVWNGSSWAEEGDLNANKQYARGFGTTNAAVVAGGVQSGLPDPNTTSFVEQYDGSSWTEIANINTARQQMGSAGVSGTSGIIFGGLEHLQVTEKWNGTSWTEVGDLNTGKEATGGAGTVTAALCASGVGGGAYTATVEEWNGASWTEIADLNEGRQEGGLTGSTTSAIHFGGYGGLVNTEQYNGTSWTEVANLPASKTGMGDVGTYSSALSISGYNNSANVTATEEWTGDAAAAVTFTSS